MNAKALLLSLVAMVPLSACNGQQNNYVKPSSPLHSILENPTRLTMNKPAESMARDYILKELPLGSFEAAVSAFISKHLTRVHRKRAAFPEAYVCVRTSDWS